jgi:pimeloyl-ACP methyl ester carboxylesterase
MGKIPDSHFDIFKSYFYQIALSPAGSDYALQSLFKIGIWAKMPLEERLNKLNIPISFFYGEHDWMLASAGETVKAKHSEVCRVWVVEDSNHHLYIDNPTEFSRVIIEDMGEMLENGAPIQPHQVDQTRTQ